jgi:hypothetical protein
VSDKGTIKEAKKEKKFAVFWEIYNFAQTTYNGTEN